MKIKHSILIATCIVTAVFACKDKNDDDKKDDGGTTKPKSELLCQKRWKIESLVSSGTDVWNTPFVAACNKDNEYQFWTNDSLTAYDMSSKCDVADPDSTRSFYKLINNNTQIILNVKLTSTNTLNDTADIIELSESTLKLDAIYSGLPASITFKHP